MNEPMFRIQFTLSFSVFLMCFSVSAAVPLSLKEALKLALQDNREILAAKASVESAKEQYDASTGKYLPSVNLEGKFTHLNDDINIDLSDIRKAMISSAAVATQVSGGSAATTTTILESNLPGFTTRVQKQDFFNASLVLTQPLYAGGKISANKDAKNELINPRSRKKKIQKGRCLGRPFSIIIWFSWQIKADRCVSKHWKV